jgi:hypothetical protein
MFRRLGMPGLIAQGVDSLAYSMFHLFHRDKDLLDKYGLKSNNAILAEESHAGLFDDLINNYSAETTAGGGAQNTARGAQV